MPTHVQIFPPGLLGSSVSPVGPRHEESHVRPPAEGSQQCPWVAPSYIPSRTSTPLSTANTARVLFSQEKLDEFSKQKNEKGEYSVNAYLRILF